LTKTCERELRDIMGKSGTLGGINRKRTSIVKKRNKSLKLNRKNKVEKQEQAPQFTSKTL
jgi:hypothetical protein